MPKEKLRNSNGITLIALIITIIVMLILVGVTVSVALNGGLFNTAKYAVNRTQVEADREELLSAVVAAIGTDGKVDFNYLDKNLPNSEWTGANGRYTSPSGNVFTVNENGVITETDSAGGDTASGVEAKAEWIKANYQTALSEAAAAGQTTEGTNAITDIAIGTDGNIVNLGLWNYIPIGGEDGIALGEWACQGGFAGKVYKGDITEDGRIEGTIPQVICIKNGEEIEIKEVKAIGILGGVRIAPVIPSTVTNCKYMFSGCTSLTVAPTIPSGVTNCEGMFSGCTSLTVAPTIPDSVTNCGSMFYDCTSLATAPAIPDSVTNCGSMFHGCTSLTGDIVINTTMINAYFGMLGNVGSETHPITLKGTCPVLEEIKNTGNSQYITIAN